MKTNLSNHTTEMNIPATIIFRVVCFFLISAIAVADSGCANKTNFEQDKYYRNSDQLRAIRPGDASWMSSSELKHVIITTDTPNRY